MRTLAERRFVFPVQAKGKNPLTRTGFKEASNDPTQLEKWKAQFGNCNWGLATGASGLIVVDCDIPKGGTREAIEQQLGISLPETLVASTGGGGLHFLYDAGGLELPTRLGIIKGIDILARTGYIIIAPSIHPSGNPYHWRGGTETTPLAPVPSELVNLINNPPKKLNEVEGGKACEGEIYLTAGMGRFEQLRKFAGRMRRWGWSGESIEIALFGFYWNQVQHQNDLPEKIRGIRQFLEEKPAGDPVDKQGGEGRYRRTKPPPAVKLVRVRLPSGEEKQIQPKLLPHYRLNEGAVLIEDSA